MRAAWKPRKLGTAVSLVMGQAPAARDCNKEGNGTPFVKVGEFGYERPVIREWTSDPKKLARETDVLICVVGATCGKINLGIECAIGRSAAAIRPDPEKLDQRYLWYFMQGKVLEMRAGSQGAAQTVISREMINDIDIPLPPLEEQQRIVVVLDEAFAAIATATANAEKNLFNAEALIAAAIAREFSKADDSWETRSFETCLARVRYPSKIQRNAFKAAGAFPIVSQEADFINGYWDDERDVLRVARPLIVFGDHTQVLKFIDFDFVLGADGVKLLLPMDFLDARFFLYFLRANPVSSKGYARHYRHLKALNVVYPLKVKQQEIAAKLDEVAKAVRHIETVSQSRIVALADLKQSLLDRAFAGELAAAENEIVAS